MHENALKPVKWFWRATLKLDKTCDLEIRIKNLTEVVQPCLRGHICLSKKLDRKFQCNLSSDFRETTIKLDTHSVKGQGLNPNSSEWHYWKLCVSFHCNSFNVSTGSHPAIP